MTHADLTSHFVVTLSALLEGKMSGALVDDLVVAERATTIGKSIVSLTFKVRYRESEQMTDATLWTWGNSSHLNLMFAHFSEPM